MLSGERYLMIMLSAIAISTVFCLIYSIVKYRFDDKFRYNKSYSQDNIGIATKISFNAFLRKTNKYKIDKYSIWKMGNTVMINYSSIGCRYRESGHCLMCDYGYGDNVTFEEIKFGIDDILKINDFKRLVLGVCGSIFDETEFSSKSLDYLLSLLKDTNIENIEFEGHYTDINRGILERIQRALKGKNVSIELGFESSNEDVREQGIAKVIDNENLISKIKLIHSFNFNVALNILYGIPGLDIQQRKEDTLKSVRWAFRNGVDSVVLFPMNIKPGTYMMYEYMSRGYKRVTHDEFIQVLNEIDVDKLDCVHVSWFGDRQYNNKDHGEIGPLADRLTEREYMEFYQSYLLAPDSKKRRMLVQDILGE